MLPLSSFAISPLSNINDPPTPLLTLSEFDITPHPETMDLLISDEILTHPLISNLPLPPMNDTNHPVLLPELEARLNNNQFSTIYKPVLIIVSFSLLTNDLSPTIVANPTLLNEYEHDMKVNNPASQYNDIAVHIVTYPLDPPAHDDTTLVFVKHYKLILSSLFPSLSSPLNEHLRFSPLLWL